MTALGGSAITPTVAEAMGLGGANFVNIEALFVAAGAPIAAATGAEDGCPTTGAAAGIAISVAAVIAGTSLSLIERIPDTEGLKNEVVIQKGHSVNFGAPIRQMIAVGGGRVREVGQANHVVRSHVEEAITEKTAALIYIKSHHAVQKGMISCEDMVSIAKENNIPLIVDAAAEEDLRKYIRLGADLVVYSGGKAIGGPTSGFICGRRDLIAACRAQYQGVGRPMKIGKEGIVGLLSAIEEYVMGDTIGSVRDEQNQRMEWLVEELQGIPGVSCELKQDEAGREIYRAYVQIDATVVGKTAFHVIRELENGNPAIFTRNHYANVGGIAVDPRPLFPGQEKLIADQLRRILSKEGKS